MGANELKLNDSDGEDEPQILPMAYLHPKVNNCVSTDPTAYENPKVLVAWSDVADHVEWIDKGIVEWRSYAIELGERNVELLQTIKNLEEFVLRVTQYQEGRPDKHDTLVLIRKALRGYS